MPTVADSPPSAPLAYSGQAEIRTEVAPEVATIRIEKPVLKNTAQSTTRKTAKSTTSRHAEKPPAIKGFKWAKKGAGFDCRAFTQNGDQVAETYIGHLGKKKLAEFREQADNRDQLRQLVRQWAEAKRKGKGNR